MKATIPIAVQPNTRVLRLERIPYQLHYLPETPKLPLEEQGYWRIWLHHDLALTQGTFIDLHDNGSITRTTIQASGEEHTFNVKDADK